VVTAHLDCNPATCQIALSRVLGRNGTLLWTQSLEAPMGQPYLLAEAVAGHLRQGYPDRARRYEISPLEVSAADYAEYLRLQDEMLHRRRAVPLAALIARAQKLRQRAPRFLEAPLLEAALLQQRFNAERDRADLEAAAAALRDARALAPTDPRPLMALLDISLRGEQLGAAEEALRRLEDLLPGDPEVEIARARLLERHGDRNGALTQLRDAARRRPAWRSLSRLADMEIRLGEHAAARRHLEELLARFPGYYDAQSLLAQLELSYGSPERAVELYTRLLQRDPRLGETSNLGVAYLLLGRYELAEQRFRQALRLQPASSFAALNLADVVLLQGRRPEAETVYRTVIGLATRDPTAAGWQLVSQRAQALAHLGQRRQAVGEAQRVLQLAPGNSEAAYEVAVVYAVVGDEASALANAEAALAQGIEPRWFTLPWFDRLREVPELRDQLAARGLRAGGKPAASPGAAAAAGPPSAATAADRR
jgi:tetratricopeptide (TPR) repeat protein